MRKLLVLALCLTVVGVVSAGGLEEGDKEVTLGASFSDLDFGKSDGFDLGSNESTDISVSWGWMLDDHHQFGLALGYIKEDFDGGDLLADETLDGTRVGGFYTYNFGGENATPYLGIGISSLGGDQGDFYDLQYGAEVGVKLYPYEHAGISIGLGYSQLKADSVGLDDADGIQLAVGLLFKY